MWHYRIATRVSHFATVCNSDSICIVTEQHRMERKRSHFERSFGIFVAQLSLCLASVWSLIAFVCRPYNGFHFSWKRMQNERLWLIDLFFNFDPKTEFRIIIFRSHLAPQRDDAICLHCVHIIIYLQCVGFLRLCANTRWKMSKFAAKYTPFTEFWLNSSGFVWSRSDASRTFSSAPHTHARASLHECCLLSSIFPIDSLHSSFCCANKMCKRWLALYA